MLVNPVCLPPRLTTQVGAAGKTLKKRPNVKKAANCNNHSETGKNGKACKEKD